MNIVTLILKLLRRLPVVTVSVIVLISLAAAWQLKDLGINNNLDVWFPADDPDLKRYQDFLATYGSDETIVIALEQHQGFRDQSGQDVLAACIIALTELDGIRLVLSPSAIAVDQVSNPWVSTDGTVALVVASLEQEATQDRQRAALLTEIDTVLAAYPVTVRKAGIGVLYEALNQVSLQNAVLFMSFSMALVIGLFWWLRYGVWSIGIAMTGILIATVWTMGLYTWTGHELNMITMVLPSLILVVGLATTIHIITGLQTGSAGKGIRSRQAWLQFIAVPCLLSALTTAGGFAALTGSPLPVVREFGLYAAIGVLLAVILILAICAIWLPHGSAQSLTAKQSSVAGIATGLCDTALARPGLVLITAVLLVLVGVSGITRLDVDTYTLDYLLPSHTVRQDAQFIETRVGPYTPLDFIVRVQRPDIDPVVLTQSVVRWVEAAQDDAAVGWSLPTIEMLNNDAGSSPVTGINHATNFRNVIPGWSTPEALRITFGINMQSARGIQKTIHSLSTLAGIYLPAGVTVEAGGYLPLYTRIINYLVETQLVSMGLAFLIVFAIIGLIFRSLVLTLIAILVNLMPLLVMLGVMGYTGIRIDVATVTTGAVVMGLIVDDTIHVLHRLQYEFCGDHDAALRRVMATTGPALVATTLLLVTGFGILALAQVRSIIWFGVLVSTASATALITDLMLLPALVVRWRPLRCRNPLDKTTVLQEQR